MSHQIQPTRTSCGQTCVAMLVNEDVQHVIASFKMLMRPDAQKYDMTNVSEIFRLLVHYKYELGPRRPVIDAMTNLFPSGLLRIHSKRFESDRYRLPWHWSVIADSYVHDPCASAPIEASRWFYEHRHDLVFYYAVTSTLSSKDVHA